MAENRGRGYATGVMGKSKTEVVNLWRGESELRTRHLIAIICAFKGPKLKDINRPFLLKVSVYVVGVGHMFLFLDNTPEAGTQ